MIDESKLTPSEQIQLGMFKATAGNQLSGELAFIRSRSPFGNWAPKPRYNAEVVATETQTRNESGVCMVELPVSFLGRIWSMFYCGLWFAIWYTLPLAYAVSLFGVQDINRIFLIAVSIAASIGVIRGMFRGSGKYRMPEVIS